VIAAINGYALGGGCELALACTIRIASENARFGQPEVKLGIIPGYGGSQRLARVVGEGRAMQLCLTAEQIDAGEAYRIGLVNKVVPAGGALAAAREMAKAILANGPVACRYVLEAVRRGLDMPLAEGLVFEATLFGLCAATADMKEGMTAFLEAARPVYWPLTAVASGPVLSFGSAPAPGGDSVRARFPHQRVRCVTGVDLVTACVFCAGLLLGSDLPPRRPGDAGCRTRRSRAG
jgi:1,4-dihydroxy-2-naphthoyl-CoA synthase